jgi:hypothetical protein
MNETQAERLIAALERIATSLEVLETIAGAIQEVNDPDTGENIATVFNIWKEGESE